MTTQVEATFVNGMLRPDVPLPLVEQTRVRLTIEQIDEWTPEKGRANWAALKASLKEHPLHFGSVKYTRDELYERDW